MVDKKLVLKKHSEATIDIMKEKAVLRGEQRTRDVSEKVRRVMLDIERELKANEGIYPFNDGAISLREIAERAKIHPTTIHSKTHKELYGEVQEWLRTLRKKETIGSAPVRLTLASRLEECKLLYEGLRQSHRETELVLQSVEHELEHTQHQLQDSRKENELLYLEVAKLQAQLDDFKKFDAHMNPSKNHH